MSESTNENNSKLKEISDNIPSPVIGQNKPISRSYSGDSFSSYSDEFDSSRSSDPKLELPPRLSSTRNRGHVEVKNTSVSRSSWRDRCNETRSLIDASEYAGKLSVWEEWMVKKLHEEQEKKNEMREKQREKREKEKEEQMKKKERTRLAQQKHKEWVEGRLYKLKLQKSKEKREIQIQNEIETEKQQRINEKAKVEYEAWMKKHEEMNKLKRIKEKKVTEQQLKEKEEKKRESEEAYQRWLEKTKEKFPETKLATSPTPAYINPHPWVGPDQDGTRRRPKSPPAPMMTLRRGKSPQQPHFRSHSVSARVKRVPKPIETHTPMRIGSAHNVGLVRTYTPLRFAGIRTSTPTKAKSKRNIQDGGSKCGLGR
ncbi:uncharacterized protein LOC100185015 isoform X1 [Ciona intestinalis]